MFVAKLHVLSCRNRNYLKVLVSKMLVLSRRLREAQGMDRSYLNVERGYERK